MPKSDEFLSWIAKVIEISRCKVYNFLRSHDNFLGARPWGYLKQVLEPSGRLCVCESHYIHPGKRAEYGGLRFVNTVRVWLNMEL